MARAGFEKTERDNVYNGMTLREYWDLISAAFP